MIEVIPLKYGSIFKKVFSQPEIFCQFVKDILGIDIKIDKVYTEYEYPNPIGFVRSKYDLFAEDVEQRIIVEIQQVKEDDFFDRFLYYHLISLVEQVGGFQEYCFDRTVYTIVVLTSVPRDGSVNFSCAVSDMSPIDEHGHKVAVYPHRLIFLCPRLVNEETPPTIKKWLSFIEDSLDGKMEEKLYQETEFQQIMSNIRKQSIDPSLLSEIKDDMAWEKAKQRFMHEGWEEGWEGGWNEGRQLGIEEGIERGIERGIEKGIIEQRRQVILQAWKMGIDEATIAKLIGLNETEVSECIRMSQKTAE